MRIGSGVLLAGLFLGALARAEDPPSATAADPAGASPLTATVTLASQYIFRGLRQSWGGPTLQGAFEYNAPHAFFGVFGSNTSSNYFASAIMELDAYGGLRITPAEDFRIDVGGIAYTYPGATYAKFSPAGSLPDVSYNTAEANLAVTWMGISFRASYALTPFFGFTDQTAPVGAFPGDHGAGVTAAGSQATRGALYLEAAVTWEIVETWIGNAHLGRQGIAHSTGLSYEDASLGLTKNWPRGWSTSVFVTATRDAAAYHDLPAASGDGSTQSVGRTTGVLSLSRTF